MFHLFDRLGKVLVISFDPFPFNGIRDSFSKGRFSAPRHSHDHKMGFHGQWYILVVMNLQFCRKFDVLGAVKFSDLLE